MIIYALLACTHITGHLTFCSLSPQDQVFETAQQCAQHADSVFKMTADKQGRWLVQISPSFPNGTEIRADWFQCMSKWVDIWQ